MGDSGHARWTQRAPRLFHPSLAREPAGAHPGRARLGVGLAANAHVEVGVGVGAGTAGQRFAAHFHHLPVGQDHLEAEDVTAVANSGG